MFGIGSDLLGSLQNMPTLTTSQQLGAILATVLTAMTAGGGIVLYVIDSSIDQKYATDMDVRLIRVSVEENQDEIIRTQETVEETQKSVHELTIIVLDGEISRTENAIRELESKETLTNQERQYLADLRRKLNDLQLQRQAIFERTMIDNER